jgi:hypothetical protein
LSESILQLDEFSTDEKKLVGIGMKKEVHDRYQECNLGYKQFRSDKNKSVGEEMKKEYMTCRRNAY